MVYAVSMYILLYPATVHTIQIPLYNGPHSQLQIIPTATDAFSEPIPTTLCGHFEKIL